MRQCDFHHMVGHDVLAFKFPRSCVVHMDLGDMGGAVLKLVWGLLYYVCIIWDCVWRFLWLRPWCTAWVDLYFIIVSLSLLSVGLRGWWWYIILFLRDYPM